MFVGRLIVPYDNELQEEILKEAHHSRFALHPGVIKMCQDLRRNV